ncbi:hypothetical protein [Corynebacterium qintianiae]|uniref:hypothetical protein n=1 Tax=Corynebacterium qintianiae TaxID=2709392 RepID=UPI0013EE107A|nr:hypothetical protein [Corynebacterium qintianiae]
MKKIHKLNVNAVETGVQLDIDGAAEGINIEYEILPQVIAAVIEEIVGAESDPHDLT